MSSTGATLLFTPGAPSLSNCYQKDPDHRRVDLTLSYPYTNLIVDKEIEIKRKEFQMFSVCELCDVVVEKVFVEEADEYGCEICWSEYGEIH